MAFIEGLLCYIAGHCTKYTYIYIYTHTYIFIHELFKFSDQHYNIHAIILSILYLRNIKKSEVW